MNPPNAAFTLRAAEPRDVPAMIAMIHELAEFERLSHLVVIHADDLHGHLFGPKPVVEAVVAEAGADLAGHALFFTNYSTFLGRPGLWLEDLYVRPAHRGRGLGEALLQHLGALANARGYGRFEWSVLDWNEHAIGFYQRMGATVLPDWRICRVTGDALRRFGPP
ncbi:MAG: GNAT family N-acetyltransferase [Burkholderiales bacterium]|nr:GNAT family N-acetyltransferase [Burkholderiales bacterium]